MGLITGTKSTDGFAAGADALPLSGQVGSAAAAAPGTSTFWLSTKGGSGLIVVLDVTAVTGTTSIVTTIQGYDKVSGKTWTLLASAAQVGVGTKVVRVSPNLTPVTNVAASDLVPEVVKITVVDSGSGDTSTWTLSAILTP